MLSDYPCTVHMVHLSSSRIESVYVTIREYLHHLAYSKWTTCPASY